MAEKVVLTNMCMVSDGNGNVLVQQRTDPKWKGITFPGGHVEYKESFTEAVIREVWEETGIRIENPVMCGIKQFQTLTDERYVVFFYKADKYSGELKSSREGEVFWVKQSELLNYQVVEDFPDMLKVFESDDIFEFYYYDNESGWGKKFF